jgi:DNA invertase Pin-like site-specific DNA recombinase/ribosomal protein L29
MRVWLYSRLSNDDDKEQNSLLNQRRILLEYAASTGDTIVGESSDDNASGMNFRRDGAAQIVKAAEAGLIDAVLVKDLSRLGRHKTQTALFIDCLREHDVRVISATEKIDSFNENDDLLMGVRGLMNDYYARDISKKIRAGYRQKQRDGIVIVAPFGYWKNKNTRQVEIADEPAETVRMIYSLYLSGSQLRDIAKELNARRRKTPAQMQAELYGRRLPDPSLWTYTTVKRILCDESYAGTLHNHLREMVNGKYGPYLPSEKQFRHENFYPALVSKTDWLEAQAELARRNGKKMPQGNNQPKHRYAGLLRCADCGAVFIPQNRWWNGKCRVEYVCKTYLENGKAHCTSHRIHEEALDAAVAGEIAALRDRLRGEEAELIQQKKMRASGKLLLDARICALQRKVESLDSDIEALLMERIQDKANSARYDALAAKLSAEQASARRELSDINSGDAELQSRLKNLRKQIAELNTALEHTPVEEAKLRALIACIHVKQDQKGGCALMEWKTAD